MDSDNRTLLEANVSRTLEKVSALEQVVETHTAQIHEQGVQLRELTQERAAEKSARVDVQFGVVSDRFDQVDTRLAKVEMNLEGVVVRLDKVEAKLEGAVTRLDKLEARLETSLPLLATKADLERLHRKLVVWVTGAFLITALLNRFL
ncbi:MAG TPA: hypothetical protein VFF16_05870 [Telluria sp.]|nr:hypothetical protein [Telluria sp.]